MIKKAEIITILAVLLFVYITDSAKAEINDVQITPEEPTTEDIITIGTFGTEARGAVTVIGSVVNITDTEIALDLTLKVGFVYIIKPWSYSEDIGILPAGTYDLTVRTIESSVVTDTYFKTFQVVPESAMTLSGSGTEQDPWLIQSLDDLNNFAADANYWAGFTRLETDVNLAGRVYERAVIASYPGDTAFTGVFDGNEHEITNLTIDDGGAGYYFLGLFGRLLDTNVEIKNLALIDPNVDIVGESWNVGSLVGVLGHGKITNCYVKGGSVVGYRDVGGLVGDNYYGQISNCYYTGKVNGSFRDVGGLAGRNFRGQISNCYSTGDVVGD